MLRIPWEFYNENQYITSLIHKITLTISNLTVIRTRNPSMLRVPKPCSFSETPATVVGNLICISRIHHRIHELLNRNVKQRQKQNSWKLPLSCYNIKTHSPCQSYNLRLYSYPAYIFSFSDIYSLHWKANFHCNDIPYSSSMLKMNKKT